MMPSVKTLPPEQADAELVAQARRGDRDAFGRIVSRYQALVCALAYNATGSLAQSEDLAQESFVVAWKQLPALCEPEKLRSWLCGIVRNLGREARRDEKFEPVLRAEALETGAFSLAAPEPDPLDQAISREEEAILWRQLEAIPESYREPLILFYREHASIEQVALALDLSEDAVRQRLTRGRRLLHEQVLAFVESALARTSPKPAFTQQVLAALPAAASSGKVAGAALAAASGSAAKAAWAAAGPLGSMFAMLGGAWVTWWAKGEATKSPRERRFVAMMTGIQVALVAAFLALGLVAMEGGIRILRSPLVRDIEISACIFLLWVGIGIQFFQRRRQFQIQHEDKTFDETEWSLRRTGLGIESNTGSSPSFWLLLKRSALPVVFLAIFDFYDPRMHTPLILGLHAGGLLLWTFFSWLFLRSGFLKNRPRRQPRLGFALGLPIVLTFLAIYTIPPVRAWNRSMSIREFVLLDATVILVYALAAGIFLWKGRSIPRCD